MISELPTIASLTAVNHPKKIIPEGMGIKQVKQYNKALCPRFFRSLPSPSRRQQGDNKKAASRGPLNAYQ